MSIQKKIKITQEPLYILFVFVVLLIISSGFIFKYVKGNSNQVELYIFIGIISYISIGSILVLCREIEFESMSEKVIFSINLFLFKFKFKEIDYQDVKEILLIIRPQKSSKGNTVLNPFWIKLKTVNEKTHFLKSFGSQQKAKKVCENIGTEINCNSINKIDKRKKRIRHDKIIWIVIIIGFIIAIFSLIMRNL